MNFSFVFLDFGARLLIQFICFSLLARSIDKEFFGDVFFSLSIFTYFVVVINSAFDSLLNKKFSEDHGLGLIFYGYSIALKLLGFMVCGGVYFFICKSSSLIFFSAMVLSFISLMCEHQDLRLRYVGDYRNFKIKFFLGFIFSPFKVFFCYRGSVESYLFFSILEFFSIFFVNFFYVGFNWRVKGLFVFFGENWQYLSKTFSSGFFIFTFFRLDQFFVYGYLGRSDYSHYLVAVRFNELLNSVVGIFSRFYIPKLYAGSQGYFFVIVRLWVIHVSLSLLVGIVLFLYANFWVPDYSSSLYIYMALCISGLWLIFGQLRGVFFVKNNFLMPDIYNAALGMFVFFVWLFSVNEISALDVALGYFLGFLVSGFVSTPLYGIGREFIIALIRRGNG
ncbi:lipopolysaccharide biosynthesis protein [Metapseudomonas otitidis]|uniref:lipopolysaccharide biosynthesis protein n=1 Tax=Metapseudomonas otitidis TaxID=319939 RepID=UPI0013F6257C|nr:hypothetical protein [Pseudomonas otitidis]